MYEIFIKRIICLRKDVETIFNHFESLYGTIKVTKKINVKEQIKQRRNIVENYGSVNGVNPEIDSLITIKKVNVHGVPCEWIVAPGADTSKRLLYIHGGAFFAGSLDSHRAISCEFSKRAGVAVLAVDYRLAPENPFPLGLDDCYDAYQWMLENTPDGKSKASNVFIVGDSAGGNLSISLLLKLKYSTLRMPDAVLPISPVLDFSGKSKSIYKLDGQDPVINKKALLQGLPLVYLFGKEISKLEKSRINKYLMLMKVLMYKKKLSKNPLVSPLYAKDLTGLPPIFINVGEFELLVDDSVRFTEKAKKQGVDIKLKVWKDMMHVFVAFLGHVPEAEECLNEMAEFIKQHTK